MHHSVVDLHRTALWLGCLAAFLARFRDRFEVLDVVLQIRNSFKADRRSPRLDACPAPVCPNQSDGHFKFLLKFAPEEVAGRSEARDGLRRADLPLAADLVLRIRLGDVSVSLTEARAAHEGGFGRMMNED